MLPLQLDVHSHVETNTTREAVHGADHAAVTCTARKRRSQSNINFGRGRSLLKFGVHRPDGENHVMLERDTGLTGSSTT